MWSLRFMAWQTNGRFMNVPQQKSWQGIKEFDLWYWFARSGQRYIDILKAKKPEFAEEIEVILEDELQQSIEESKKKREEWSRGIWHYNQ